MPEQGHGLRRWSAAEALALGGRLAAGLGIGEPIDITGLDRLGVPVSVCLRPGGVVARIHAGRGLSTQQARCGALMESIECAVAEAASLREPLLRLPLGDVQARLPAGLTLLDFSPRIDADLRADRPTAVVRGTDLLAPHRPLLPAELLLMPAPDDGAGPLYGWSSNGLACGGTLHEATLHALLEVLERDTIAMSLARRTAVFVDPRSWPAPWPERAAQWRALGVQMHVRHLPGDFGLPCFEVTLHEPGAAQVEFARGWGLHGGRVAAFERAVGEAALARLFKIHAQQPGMAAFHAGRQHVDPEGSAVARRQFLHSLAAPGPGIDFASTPERPFQQVPGALQGLLQQLREAGFRHVFRKRLRPGPDAPPLPGLEVVKLAVPGCENIVGGALRAGPRLVALARQAAPPEAARSGA